MFQTRNDSGNIKTFQTLREAFAENRKDDTVWKISTDRVRLIKHIRQDSSTSWLNRPMEDYIKRRNLPPPGQDEIEGLDY